MKYYHYITAFLCAIFLFGSCAPVKKKSAAGSSGDYHKEFQYFFYPELVSASLRKRRSKIVLLKVDIDIREKMPSGLLEHRFKHKEITVKRMRRLLVEKFRRIHNTRLINLPALKKGLQHKLQEHIALYELIGGTLIRLHKSGGNTEWQDKVKRFEYSIGRGLGFIIKKTGADLALVVSGTHYSNDSDRSFVPDNERLGHITIPDEKSTFVAGLIDLRTGRLLWFGYMTDTLNTLTTRRGVGKMVTSFIKSIPE